MSRSFVIISFFFWPATASMLRPMLVPNIFFGSSMARASGGCFDADHLIYSAAVHFTPSTAGSDYSRKMSKIVVVFGGGGVHPPAFALGNIINLPVNPISGEIVGEND